MQRKYRCYNCLNEKGQLGRDFVAEIGPGAKRVTVTHSDSPGQDYAVECPECGAVNGDEKTGGHNIHAVKVIHFEASAKLVRHIKTAKGTLTGDKGCGHIACNPAVKTGVGVKDSPANVVYTGEPAVVNCPACQQTAEFKAATGATFDPAFDLPVEVTPNGLVIPTTL